MDALFFITLVGIVIASWFHGYSKGYSKGFDGCSSFYRQAINRAFPGYLDAFMRAIGEGMKKQVEVETAIFKRKLKEFRERPFG